MCIDVTNHDKPQASSIQLLVWRGSEDDRRRIGLDRQPRGRGVLKTVATMPFNLMRGGVALVAGGVGDGSGPLSPRMPVSPAGDGLADQWIDFLIEQAERDGAAAATAGADSSARESASIRTQPNSGDNPVPTPGASADVSMEAAQVELLARLSAADQQGAGRVSVPPSS
jgi:hypothetical protein